MNDVLKTMQEMCKYYGDDCERNGKRCPFDGMCLHIPVDWNKQDVENLQRAIDKWQYPKYPTWEQWLLKNGYITPQFSDFDPIPTNVIHIHVCLLTAKARERIPRDIAEKLNIDPIQ